MDQRIEMRRLRLQQRFIGPPGVIHAALAMERECLLELHDGNPGCVCRAYRPHAFKLKSRVRAEAPLRGSRYFAAGAPGAGSAA